MVDVKDKVISYLIENSACDICGKCAYYKAANPNEEFTPCKDFEKEGNVACRNGMIKYFENESNKILENESVNLLSEFILEIKKFGIAKVSTLSGIARTTLTKWCRGEIVPTFVNAQKVANAMGLEFLLFEKE